MPHNLIERLEKRINNDNFKGSFVSRLRQQGHFLSFNEKSKDHTYAIRLDKGQIEEIINQTLNFVGVYTLIVSLNNGLLQVKTVA